MLRRSHKKSRNGCSECKRRHIRCDQQRPSCLHCTTGNRNCEYLFRYYVLRKENASTDDPLLLSPTEGFSAQSSLTAAPSIQNDPSLLTPIDVDVNMQHLKLLVHFSSIIFAPEIQRHLRDAVANMLLRTALNTPFLMHEVLAFSARHLSTLDSSNFQYYQCLSIELQTKAIALYNADGSCADQQSCVASLLFSSLLARHTLIDVLALRHVDFADFLNRFVQCVRIHRGKRAIVESTWSVLSSSELGPFIGQGLDPSGNGHQVEIDQHLDSLLAHIEEYPPESVAIYRTALGLLRAGYQDLNNPEQNPYGLRLIFSWLALVPEKFIDFLEQQRPEAIAILGRYGILLHSGRSLWQIGDAGAYLLHMVSTFLGEGWEAWLAFPKELGLSNRITCL
ncbi:hypothetical protein F5Y10DRAFT_147146 [Nemania abortiva]|nr:hypothetical protein F5Y10DRAFT_147146 [Nemania abortiva]